MKVLSGHQGDVMGLIFTHDNKYNISGSGDDSIFIWFIGNWEKLRDLVC